MSAYLGDIENKIISLTGASSRQAVPSTENILDPSQAAPSLLEDLHSFFINARKIEGVLAQERLTIKTYQDEIKLLQAKYSKLLHESQAKYKDFNATETSLKNQVAEYQTKEQDLIQQIATLTQQLKKELSLHKSMETQYREKFKNLHNQYTQVYQYADALKKQLETREEHFKFETAASQQNIKGLQEHIQELTRQIESIKIENKKLELNCELLKANLAHYKQREASLKDTIQNLESRDRTDLDQSEKYKKEINKLWTELSQYKAAWGKIATIDQKSKEIQKESIANQRKIEELTESLSAEKQRHDRLDELLRKERGEKQLALTHLHTAEARLAQSHRELEALRMKELEKQEDPGLDLEF